MNGEQVPDERQVNTNPVAASPIAEPLSAAPPIPTPSPHVDTKEEKIEERMSAFERSTVRLTQISIAVAIVVGLAVFAQWYEMHTSGVDTKAIAEASKQQASAATKSAQAARDFADTAALINTGIGDAVKKLDAQAKATQKSAKTAEDTLHVSERAYLILANPTQDFARKRIGVLLFNAGHIPSGPIEIVVHEITTEVNDPSSTVPMLNRIVERHWKVYRQQSAAPNGSPFGIEVTLPAVVEDQIASGRQEITVAAVMTYNDGFSKTPQQKWNFCLESNYVPSTKEFRLVPCDTDVELPKLIRADAYPSPQFEEK